MNGGTRFFGVLKRRNHWRVARKFTTTNCARNAHQLLIHNSTGANILMPHFTVAHHGSVRANGQANVFATGLDQRVRPIFF